MASMDLNCGPHDSADTRNLALNWGAINPCSLLYSPIFSSKAKFQKGRQLRDEIALEVEEQVVICFAKSL